MSGVDLMSSILQWMAENLGYVVGSSLVVSLISLTIPILQIRMRKKYKAIEASVVAQKEVGTLTVEFRPTMSQAQTPIAWAQHLHAEQAGPIAYSFGGLQLMSDVRLSRSNVSTERANEQADDTETGTNTLATIEGHLPSPGQSGRYSNVALKKSIGVPNALSCGSGV